MTSIDIPRIDLAEHGHPQYREEWGWGPRRPDASQWWSRRHVAIGGAEPDVDGHTVTLNGGITRDQIPSLIGFLTAVYQASDPTAAARRRVEELCDCGWPGDDTLPHERFCPVVTGVPSDADEDQS